jgi:lipoprotein-anchoring transpeptidase ErfK/SrfK
MLLLGTLSLTSAQEPQELRRSPTSLHVRAAPALDAVSLGMLAPDEPFAVYAYVSGTGCGGDGWGTVMSGGFACLERTTITTDLPVDLPRLVAFSPPDPKDVEAYVATGLYPEDADAPMVPYIYGKRWGRWHGRVWKDVASWQAGEPAADQLERRHSYRFVGAQDTDRGRVFVRPNGSIVPATDLFLFAVSSFGGRDLAAEPLPAGATLAWAVGSKGARVRATASTGGDVLRILPFHTPVELLDAPPDTVWWPVLGGGFVHGSVLARFRPAPRPEGTADDALWIDVDLREQTLALVRGDTPVFVTLISSGVEGHGTPVGTFTIYDKLVSNDMKSLVGAKDAYHVEEVPWVIHFKPRYALHGAFWHDAFGHPVSHGCVNLAPRDARFVFDRVLPVLPPGFESVAVPKGAPGTTIRIRE